VLLAAQAVKMGYMWSVGKGDKVRFWEDTWFGSAPLAVQFWGLYCLCNEKTKTVTEVVCNGEIRLSFRRTFSEDMMQTWCELVEIVEQVNLRDEPDSVVWVWNRSGAYSSHSFYAIINYRGIKHVYIPAI
jgi:hypothetical protein